MAKKKQICIKCKKENFIKARKLCLYCYNMEKLDSLRKNPKKRKPRKSLSKKKSIKKPAKAKSVVTLKKKLWQTFSWFIRLRDSNDDGFGNCITCDKYLFWRQLQAGHFIPQHGNLNTVFHEQNVHSQCPQCNIYLHGNQFIYSKKIDEKYGLGTADKIHELSKIDKVFTVEELEQMIVYYTNEVRKLLTSKHLRK